MDTLGLSRHDPSYLQHHEEVAAQLRALGEAKTENLMRNQELTKSVLDQAQRTEDIKITLRNTVERLDKSLKVETAEEAIRIINRRRDEPDDVS